MNTILDLISSQKTYQAYFLGTNFTKLSWNGVTPNL